MDEYEFDFSKEEYLDIFYEDNQWVYDNESLKELWRLETKNDLLIANMSDSASSSPREDLKKRYSNRVRRINQQKEGNLVGSFLKDTSNREYMSRVKVCQQNGWMDSLNVVIGEIKNIVLKDVEKFTFSEEQLKAYETAGGTPFLDNGYTVFGEVVSGIEIIDSICTSPTLPGDKPQEPIIILSVKINS